METISVLYSNAVSVTRPLGSLTGVDLHLCSIICQGCQHSRPQRKPILHVITDAVTETACRNYFFFLCASKYDISGAFSERCRIILSESTRNYSHVVVVYCTGCVVSQRSAV